MNDNMKSNLEQIKSLRHSKVLSVEGAEILAKRIKMAQDERDMWYRKSKNAKRPGLRSAYGALWLEVKEGLEDAMKP